MTLRQSWARAQSSLLERLRPKPPGPAGSPSILVVGACQGSAIAQAMRLLLPEAGVRTLPLHRLQSRFRSATDLAAFARDFDAVYAYPLTGPFRDGSGFEALRGTCRLFAVPPIVFAAFHPDSIYVGPMDRPEIGALVPGPMGHYHSALVLFAYLEGLPEEAALRLFGPEVYAALGYLDAWEAAADGLLTIGRHADHPLEADLARWTRRGCFMHSLNHPKLFVLGDVARGLLHRAGFGHAEVDLDGYMADTLIENGTWPVYRPIAEHYGVPGSDLFLRPPGRKGEEARTMTRDAFVRASYASYRAADQARLVNDRVAHWRSDPGIRSFLADAAGA